MVWPQLCLLAFALAVLCGTPRPAGAQQALVIQDVTPWNSNAWTTELGNYGIPTTIVGSAALPADLTQYDLIITTSVQGPSYATALMARQTDFEAYVIAGGVLIWSGCTDEFDSPFPDPPFGGASAYEYDPQNDIADPISPLLDGVVAPINGSWASHNYITPLPGGANVVLTHSVNGEAVLYTHMVGSGLLISTGITWEIGWVYGWPGGAILTNAVAWAEQLIQCVGADGDLDGFSDCDGDCDDSDPSIYPAAPEVCDDGIDSNCDGQLDEFADADGDGFTNCDDPPDCDDFQAGVYPGNVELCDGLDSDCDGWAGADEVDADGDGQMVCEGDCDDTDATIGEGFTELCDGIDNDCDGEPASYEQDGDGDGFMECEDCNDNDPDVFPGAVEICDDGVDSDCLSDLEETEVDNDGDGFSECGGDCEDEWMDIHPDAVELCDGVDNDCDPSTDEFVDADADGYNICAGDCDDMDPAISPIATEVCDYVDNNCDGLVDEGNDLDHDGWSSCDGQDCDDQNSHIHPGAEEIPYNGVDDDCEDGDLTDIDGDGWDGGPLVLDCDDHDPEVYPGAPEVCDDGKDGDCDGASDEEDPDCVPRYLGGGMAGFCYADQAGPQRGGAWILVVGAAAWLVCRRRRQGRG